MRALAFALLLVPSAALAAGLKASVQRTEVSTEEPIILTLSVEGGRAGDPQLPDLGDFQVRSRGQSTSVQIVNGNISTQTSYTFELWPKAPGSYVIPPAQVVMGGQPYRSEPINVRVLAAGARPSNDDRAAYVTAEVSKDDPFVGEEVIYTFRLYRRVQVRNADLQLPSFDGFTSIDLGKNEYTANVGGVQYVVTELKRALYPQEAGTREVASASLSADIASGKKRRGADPMDDFFGSDPFSMFDRGPAEHRVLRTATLPLNVKALPPAPAGYSGLVGAFSIEATLSSVAMKVGESATLTLTVTGSGNASAIPDLHPTLPTAFKVYDDKPENEVTPKPDGVSGKRVMKKALVAAAPGEFTVPPIELVYFEPESQTYKTTRTTELAMRVAPGDGPEQLNLTQGIVAPPSKVEVARFGEDLLPLRSSAGGFLSRRGPGAAGVLGSLLMPPFLFAGLLVWQRRRERVMADPKARRRRGALERFNRAAADLPRALKDYFGDLLDVSGGALTPHDVRQALLARGVEAGLVERAYRLFAELEAAQYAGAGAAARLEGAADLIRELDRAVR